MIAPLCPEHRLIVLAMIVWSWAANAASAQALDQRSTITSSFATVKARVALGDVVYVTETSEYTIKGKLAEPVTDDAVRVTFKADVRTVAAAGVRPDPTAAARLSVHGRTDRRRGRCHPWGLIGFVADPNECSGMCPEEYTLIAIGAVVGGISITSLREG